MPGSHELIARQVIASRRDEEDAMMGAVAALGLVVSIVAVVFGVRFFKQKRQGLAAALFLLSGVAMLACLGISALLVLVQFAWH